MAGTATQPALKVQVSPDRLGAFLVPCPGVDYSALTFDEVLSLLTQAKIKITPVEKENVAKLIDTLRAGSFLSEPVLMAQGRKPVEPSDPEFVLDERYRTGPAPANDEESVNFYERRLLISAEAGTALGSIQVSQPGQDGCDIYGNVLKPRKKPAVITLGENVTLDPDGRTVRAAADGQVVFKNSRIQVKTILDVNGDVDFKTGNIESATDVVIHGSVRDLFIIRSKRNIFVQGMVEAASLFAGGDITIVGGVEGREKALLKADGNIHVRFIDFVYLSAGADVEIARESVNSTLISDGWVDLSRASLIAGHAFGLKGMEVKTIGSPAGVKTTVGVGINPLSYQKLLSLDDQMKNERTLIQKIRTSVEPLLELGKQLTAEQREKITELVYQAQGLEEDLQNKETGKNKILETFPALTDVELRVTSRIFPDTVILIGSRYTTIEEELEGPVKFMSRPVNGIQELLVINTLSGSTRILLSGQVGPHVLEIPEK